MSYGADWTCGCGWANLDIRKTCRHCGRAGPEDKYKAQQHPLAVPEWFATIPVQQQSVLLLALRGPDGVRKHHPCKELHKHYRGTILRGAWCGDWMRPGEKATDSFMDAEGFGDDEVWRRVVKSWLDSVDELPHHYIAHTAHAAQILGYHHPDERVARCWGWFYLQVVADGHFEPESKETMDRRLSDWNREHWKT